ncbi:Crp/Fnr family transcriptional regulator [Paenibacillus sp. WLX1005]|uniref:Crp/Fnr family transcriptional regulator n=1 Tax=unclassified Paenibacillus TaxID=185978 RepID=UPI00398422AC
MQEIHNQQRLHAYLQQFGIEDVFHEPLLPHVGLFAFEPGEVLCAQGERSEILYVLVKGTTKTSLTSPEGKTLVLSLKTPPEMIGDIEYVEQVELMNTVQAVTPVEVLGIRYQWLYRYGQDHPPLLRFLLHIITYKFRVKSDSMSFNLMYPVETRLASYLLSVTTEQYSELSTGHPSDYSLTDIANLIGTSYRHLNRVIRQFSEQGMIRRERGLIVIKDRPQLEELASKAAL